MSCGGVIIAGQHRSHLIRLIEAITRSEVDNESTNGCFTWEIDNKYYTANVTLHVLDISETVDVPLSHTTNFRAIILVYKDPISFQSVQQWWTTLDEDIEYDIKLATFVDGNLNAASDKEWRLHAQEWLANNLIEFIHIPEVSITASAFKSIKTENINNDVDRIVEEDQNGIDRMIDALQSYMWPGMKRKSINGSSDSIAATAVPDDFSLDTAVIEKPSPIRKKYDDFLYHNDADDGDDVDIMFSEVAHFKSKMATATHSERASAAADLLMRLRLMLGEDDSDSDM